MSLSKGPVLSLTKGLLNPFNIILTIFNIILTIWESTGGRKECQGLHSKSSNHIAAEIALLMGIPLI